MNEYDMNEHWRLTIAFALLFQISIVYTIFKSHNDSLQFYITNYSCNNDIFRTYTLYTAHSLFEISVSFLFIVILARIIVKLATVTFPWQRRLTILLTAMDQDE